MATEPADARAQLAEVPMNEISAEKLIGTAVYGIYDESVGEVGDVILTGDGKIDAIIVDVGGFLGLGEKPVAVAFDDLKFLADGDSWRIHTNFSEEQLENQVAYDADTYAEQRDAQRLRVN
jgi:sporulation protein YlmC with PRC-barrel domain